MKASSSYGIATGFSLIPAIGLVVTEFNLVALLAIVVLLSPIFLPLRPRIQDRVVFAVTMVFASCAVYIFASSLVMLHEADSLSDFEGPNGEGSPIAIIFALVLMTVTIIIPWVIAAKRNAQRTIKQFKKPNKTDQTDRLPRPSQELFEV